MFGGRPELPLTLSALVSTTTTTSTRHRCRPPAPVPVRPGDRTTFAPAVARRRPRCRPTLPGSRRIRRADAAPCVLCNSSLEPQSQRPVMAAHTRRSSSSSYTVSQTWCYQSAPTVEPILRSHCTSARLFTTLPLTATHACIHKHELQLTPFTHIRAFTSTNYSQLISTREISSPATQTRAFHVYNQLIVTRLTYQLPT